MKKLFVLMAAMGLVTTAFAGPGKAVMPDLMPAADTGHWNIGLTALWMRPTVSGYDLFYGDSQTSTTVLTPTSSTTYTTEKDLNVNHHFHWGFQVDLGYQFPCYGNDVTLSYLRIHDHHSDSFAGTEIVQTPLTFTTVNAPTAFSGSSKLDLDQVDLVLGQSKMLTKWFDLRLFTGVRYTRLDHTLDGSQTNTVSETFGGTTASVTTTNSFSEDEDFRGIGPLFGATGNYYFAPCWGLVASFDAAFLIGNPNETITSTDTSVFSVTGFGTFTDVNYDTFDSGTDRSVVPVLDGKLGVFWDSNLYCNSKVRVEGGYRAMHYFNMIDDHHDLAYNGPYLGATVSI